VTQNPTPRPFVWGVLFFLCLVALWPGTVAGDRPPAKPRCQVAVDNKTPYRALVHFDGVYWGWVNAQQAFTFKGVPPGNTIAYATTQYAEYFWGPKPLKCAEQASWTLSF
jgi:hypothetical protein